MAREDDQTLLALDTTDHNHLGHRQCKYNSLQLYMHRFAIIVCIPVGQKLILAEHEYAISTSLEWSKVASDGKSDHLGAAEHRLIGSAGMPDQPSHGDCLRAVQHAVKTTIAALHLN